MFFGSGPFSRRPSSSNGSSGEAGEIVKGGLDLAWPVLTAATAADNNF